MTSPRRRQDSPIRAVELKVTFKGGRDELKRIEEAVPEARMRNGALEVTIRGEGPAQVEGGTKVLADRVRGALEGTKKDSGDRKKRASSKRL